MGLADRAEDPYADDEEDDDSTQHSIKRSYAAKLLSPLLGYDSYPILHFTYDLVMWTDIGSKRNLGRDMPLRLMMAGSPMSPLYWASVKDALLDMVRQCGYPRIFATKAPYEKSFPYHVFVVDQLHKQHLHRQDSASIEALHMAHILTENVRGVNTGVNCRGRGKWSRHLLQDPDLGPDQGRVAVMLRLEFQDGTRKAPTQDYHGSGRVHDHWLEFAEKLQSLRLDRCASASSDGHSSVLKGYIAKGQMDNKHQTPWQVHEQASDWDEAHSATRLHHTQRDHDLGVRAFFPDTVEAIPCHEDVQECDDDGALQAYLVKYPVKFSDSFSEEFLSDEHGGDKVAQTVLSRYRPLEPEMVLQLFGQKLRQWRCNSASGGKRNFRVPLPDAKPMPEIVTHYEQCAWRTERTTLLEFLRKTNNKGQINRWLVQKHQKAIQEGTTTNTLEAFVSEYKMFGEQLVAAEVFSWRNEKALWSMAADVRSLH